MNSTKAEDQLSTQKTRGRTWGQLFKSSLLTGLALTGVWVILMLVTQSYDPTTAEGLSGLLANGLFYAVVLPVPIFAVKALWYSARRQIIPAKVNEEIEHRGSGIKGGTEKIDPDLIDNRLGQKEPDRSALPASTSSQENQIDKNKIAIWAGYVGGGTFFILNIVTKGKVPGGFQGGVGGFIIGYALARLILAVIPTKKKAQDSVQDSTET